MTERLEVKWCGFDYGQCVMEPGGLRNPLLFNDICKAWGKPELVDDCIQRYRTLKEKYKDYSSIKEGHRDEIYSYVLHGDPEAIELFGEKEQEFLDMGVGLPQLLDHLAAQGIETAVVSELKKTLGPVGTDIVSRFLKRRDLVRFFPVMYTPQGKIDLAHDSVDERYRGRTKQSGELYDELLVELGERGIAPAECVMIGDKPATDIEPAHERGMLTVQYKGFIDLGPSSADLVVDSFAELTSILVKKEG